MFKRDLVSPLPQDYKPKQDLGTRLIKPYADTAVNYGKMMAGAYGSVPLSIGSFAARKVGANETAENLAQKAINLRNKTGYGGKDAPLKAINTTVDALIKTYVAANIPKTIASGVKYLGTPTVKDVVKQAVSQPQQVIPQLGNALKNFTTNNERDFFLKGRTPTYELGMPTRVFRR